MRQFLIAMLLLLAIQFYGQSGSEGTISGMVSDLQTGEPLPGATISVKGMKLYANADPSGNFRIKNIPAGNHIVLISYVGYETVEIAVSMDAGDQVLNAAMVTDIKTGNEIVVTASNRPEKVINAPAPVSVITYKMLDQFPGSNVGEIIAYIQGVEFVRTGVDGIAFNARGLNSAFNNKVFQLVDGRNSMGVGSGGLPMGNNATVVKEDIERIEIVTGPQSALYGPNAHNAVFNTITKDPRKFEGTTVSLTAGNRNQFSGRFRQAAKIGNKWAYKFTGEYAGGTEFNFIDSVKAGGGPGNIYGPAVVIPERNVDRDFKHVRGEGHLYYKIFHKTDLIVSGGGSSNSFVQVTTSGRNQMKDVSYSFVQARLVQSHFLLNVYNAWGSLGSSYVIPSYTRDYWNRTHALQGRLSPDSAEQFALRYGNRFREQNQRFNAEAMYKHDLPTRGLLLTVGISYQKDKPNSFGINLVDSFQKIRVSQYGAAMQLEKTLPAAFRFIVAARLDHHSNFGSFVSPRFALMRKMGDGNLRITWARAYAMPSILTQYASINSFLFGNGNGVSYIPNLSKFSNAAYITTTPLKPEEVSTWELGYKGRIMEKLFVDVNGYYGLSNNFLSPPQTMGGRVIYVGGIKVTHNPAFAGQVVNDTLKNASFLTYFNYGEVSTYGIDAGLFYKLSTNIGLAFRYSWFGSNITRDNFNNDANKDKYVSEEERSLNAPRHRGTVMLSFENLFQKKLYLNLNARVVEKYNFYSGSQIGTEKGRGSWGKVDRPQGALLKNFNYGALGGFASFDLYAGYKLNEQVNLNAGITNLFNTEQIEFVSSPSIGRLISVELKMHVLNSKKTTRLN